MNLFCNAYRYDKPSVEHISLVFTFGQTSKGSMTFPKMNSRLFIVTPGEHSYKCETEWTLHLKLHILSLS
jgi:hypothetical protein